MKALYVSLNQSYEGLGVPVDDIRWVASYAWRMSRSKLRPYNDTLIVPVVSGTPLTAFQLLATYTTDLPWFTPKGERKTKAKRRVGLVLGEVVTIDPKILANVPKDGSMRNGCALVELGDD